MLQENWAETHRNVQFSNNVTMTLRQQPGFLYPLCGSAADYSGNKAARIENRFGRVKMVEETTRNGDTNNVDVDSLARFIKPGRRANVAPLLDPADAEVTDVSLGSAIVQEVAQATATYHDDMFIRGMYGNGYAGEDGSTAVPFKAANTIAHAGTGITKNKLLDLQEMIIARKVNVQRERPIVMVTPKDVTALMKIEEYVNTRYGEGTPLANGELKPWLIFRFMLFQPDAESLPTSYANIDPGTGTRYLPVWVPSGMHRGKWVEFEGSIDDRADKNHSKQFWGAARSACVRTDEDKCFILQTQ